MRSLVLSGGAFRGAAQLPVIEHLMQQHEYNYIYGVSVGAINGAMVAQEKVLELRRMWENIDSIGGFLKLKWYWPFKGIYSMHPLREKIERLVSLKDVKIPLSVGLVSLTDQNYYHLHTKSMMYDYELWDAIHASSSIKGLMVSPSIQIKGTNHYGADGGFRNGIPIPPRRGETNAIDIISCVPLRTKDNASIDVLNGTITKEDIKALVSAHPGAKITLYNPLVNLGPSFLANPKTIKWRMHQGELMIKNPITV